MTAEGHDDSKKVNETAAPFIAPASAAEKTDTKKAKCNIPELCPGGGADEDDKKESAAPEKAPEKEAPKEAPKAAV